MKELLAIGAAIAIGIMLVLGVSSLIQTTSQAASDARWQEDVNFVAMRMISLFGTRANGYGTACMTDASLVRVGVYPSHVVNASGSPLNEFGGGYAVCGSTRSFWIYTQAVPGNVCVAMLTAATNIQRVVNVRVGAALASAQAATPVAAANIALDTANTTCSGATMTIGFEIR